MVLDRHLVVGADAVVEEKLRCLLPLTFRIFRMTFVASTRMCRVSLVLLLHLPRVLRRKRESALGIPAGAHVALALDRGRALALSLPSILLLLMTATLRRLLLRLVLLLQTAVAVVAGAARETCHMYL